MKTPVLRHMLGWAGFLAATVLRLVAADAPDDQAVAHLRTAVEEVLAAAYPPDGGEPSSRTDLRRVLEKYVDAELLTKRAIGPSWRTFTPAQQQRAVALFSELVFRTYGAKIGSGSRPTIEYHPAVVLAEDRRELPIAVTQDGKPASAVFRFERIGGEWRIYDIVVEGVSLVANYRAQFNDLLQRKGSDGLFRALENKLAETSGSAK
jgi:phospholipid transport system substrate-binding protein